MNGLIKLGVCKECLEDVPINEYTQCIGETEKDFEFMGGTFKADKGKVYDIWECPYCGYPHHEGDFLGMYYYEDCMEMVEGLLKQVELRRFKLPIDEFIMNDPWGEAVCKLAYDKEILEI